ncbi:MAG TPA: hypothetical protein VNL35_07190 [Chloroflexota bacterium]|nr:hypothetical protein [Chloroflexota bacterium]
MQHSDQPEPAAVAQPQTGGMAPRPITGGDLLPRLRRYLMTRSVVCGVVVVVLLLHLVAGKVFDLGTLLLLAVLYALIVGTGGLEAARNSGAGSDSRRQERLAEDALRRAGRLQSHLEPCTATDDVVNRILASGTDPRKMAILAGNEVEDALRAVYRHFSDAERMAGTSNGTDLPLTFLVQELIWRALLSPDIYDTAEPILALREIAMSPRAGIQPRVATDIARATQAVVLRVQSLGIDIHPRRVPLSWLREPPEEAPEPVEPNHADDVPQPTARELFEPDDGDVIDGDRLDPTEAREPVVSREARVSSGGDGGDSRH